VENPEDMVDFVEQDDGTRVEIKQRKVELGEEVKNESGGRIYRVITREYMAQGYDGFEALKNRKYIVDDEEGQIMSTIIRSFLLGSSYIFRHKQLLDAHTSHLSSRTSQIISRARAQHQSSPFSSLGSSPSSPFRTLHSPPFSPTDEEVSLMSPPLSPSHVGRDGVGKRHVVQHDWGTIRAAMLIARHEHLSCVDVLEGHEMRHTPSRSATMRTPGAYGDRNTPSKSGRDAAAGVLPSVPSGVSPSRRPTTPVAKPRESYFVHKASKEELETLGEDLAIVCPLVDGRLRDEADG